MNKQITDDDLFKIIEGSKRTAFGAYIAQAVSMRFRSMHYLSSELLRDCIVLNLVLNDEITPTSADKFITAVRRRNKSFYTTVESAFFAVEDRFDEYARTVLDDDYDKTISLGMRTANYIIYVISRDLSSDKRLNKYEVYHASFDYDELNRLGIALSATLNRYKGEPII